MLAKGEAVKKTSIVFTAEAFFFVVAPATRPLTSACLLVAQRTIKGKMRGPGRCFDSFPKYYAKSVT